MKVKHFEEWLVESNDRDLKRFAKDLKFEPMQKDKTAVIDDEDLFGSWELRKKDEANQIQSTNIHIQPLKIVVNPDSSAKDINYKSSVPTASYGKGKKPPSLQNLPTDVVKFATRWFMHGGLSKEGAAAVVANLWRESYLNPIQRQIGGGPGRGIAQWDNGGERWNNFTGNFLPKFKSSDNKLSGFDASDLEAQLGFVLYELKSKHKSLYTRLKTPGSMRIKTVDVLQEYEIARDRDKPEEQQVRYDIARDIYYNVISQDPWANTIAEVVTELKKSKKERGFS